MTFKIEYEFLPLRANMYWATTMLNGERILSCGESWEDVRTRHINKLKEFAASLPPPKPEEIEL